MVIFERLTDADLRAIVTIWLSDLRTRLGERQIHLNVSEAAYDWLARRGYQPEFGARPLRRLVQRAIEDPLAVKLLSGEVPDESEVRIDVGPEGLTMRVGSADPAP